MKNRNILMIVCSVFALGGCAVGQNDFNCSSGDENALCGSSRTIYKATDGDLKTNDTLTYIKDGEKQQMTVSELKKLQNGDASHNSSISEISKGKANSLSAPLSFSYDGDVLRKDVQTMRVWIAPFIDSNDNLHLSSMVYTDIAQKSWELGTVNPNKSLGSSLSPVIRVTSSISTSEEIDQGKYRVPDKEKPRLQALFSNQSSSNGEK